MSTPPPPIVRARRTDPETSHAAAASIDPDTLRQSLRDVYDLLAAAGSATDERLVTGFEFAIGDGHVKPQSPSGIRSRRSELVRAGLVRDTGRREILSSGRQAIVWEVVRD